jgi:hypothetical protein
LINNEQERGWLAGYLEGEGCFHLKRTSYKAKDGGLRRYVQPTIALASTDLDIVKRVQRMIGGSIYKKRADRLGPHDKQSWQLHIGGRDRCIDIMLAIRDLMGERRRVKIDELLATQFGRIE